MQTKPNQFLINEGAPSEGRLRVCTPRTLLGGCVSIRGFSDKSTGGSLLPARTWAGTIRAGRPGRLTVCYSWGCPSSVPAGTGPSPRSSVPGTISLPLQREKLRVRNALGRDSPARPCSLLPHWLCWEREAPPAVRGGAKDEDEEMPHALWDRMGVRAADSSSILGKAKGTQFQSQNMHGQPTKRLPQQGS